MSRTDIIAFIGNTFEKLPADPGVILNNRTFAIPKAIYDRIPGIPGTHHLIH